MSSLQDRNLDEIDPWLRNRIASIILTPTTRKSTLPDTLETYYRQHAKDNFLAEWPTLRGIALALASQVGDETCMWDFLATISRDSLLLAANCNATDSYHAGGREAAVSQYLDRLNNLSIPEETCLWELCYIGECAVPRKPDLEWKEIEATVARRRDRTDSVEIKKYCHEILARLAHRRRGL